MSIVIRKVLFYYMEIFIDAANPTDRTHQYCAFAKPHHVVTATTWHPHVLCAVSICDFPRRDRHVFPKVANLLILIRKIFLVFAGQNEEIAILADVRQGTVMSRTGEEGLALGAVYATNRHLEDLLLRHVYDTACNHDSVLTLVWCSMHTENHIQRG